MSFVCDNAARVKREGRGGAKAASSPAREGFLTATAAASAAGAWQYMTSRIDMKEQAI